MVLRKPTSHKKTHAPRIALVVLGMHRSGTSALAGVLGHMGADLPKDLMAPSAMNEKGFFESNRVTALNEALLDSAGFRWYSLPRFPQEWYDSPKAGELMARAVAEIAREYEDSHLFVLKDPRVCRLVPFWDRVLRTAGCQPAYVCTWRYPLDTASSLNHWANYEQSYGLLLWLRHVLDAEAGSRGLLRVFTSYERLLRDWHREVVRIGNGLSLVWPRSPARVAGEVEAFLSRDLQHFARRGEILSADAELPEWIGQVLEILERWSESGEQTADHTMLDRIRTALDRAEPTFAGLVQRSQLLHLEQREAQKQLAELTTALDQARSAGAAQASELTAALEEVRSEVARLQAAQASTQQAKVAAENRIAELTTALDQARSAGAAQASELTAALEEVRSEVARLQAAQASTQQAKVAAENRIAELTTALDQARSAGDAQAAELTAAFDEASARIEQLVAERDDAREGVDLLRSELAQRKQELDDLYHQSAEDAGQLKELSQLLEDARRENETISRYRTRDRRHLDDMVRRVSAQMRNSLDVRLGECLAPADAAKEHAAVLASYARRQAELELDLAHSKGEIERLQVLLDNNTGEHAQIVAELERALAAGVEDHQERTNKAIEELQRVRIKLDDERNQRRALVSDMTGIGEILRRFELAGGNEFVKAPELEQRLAALFARSVQDQNEKMHRISELEEHIMALRNSTSWRITGPLRFLSLFVKRLGTRL